MPSNFRNPLWLRMLGALLNVYLIAGLFALENSERIVSSNALSWL